MSTLIPKFTSVSKCLAMTLCALPLSSVADPGYFLSLGAGYGKVKFSPDYSFVDGRPPREFDDHKEGFVGSLGGAYRMQLGEKFDLDLGADFIYQDAEWTLSLPWEPADFRYEIPYTLGLKLSPGWEPAPRWRLFAEFGLEYGRVKERKSSPVTSSYDADEWVGGFLAGAGVGYRINDQFSLSLSYRRIQYNDLTYKSYLPDGTHWETIEDSPRSEFTSLGLMYRF